MAWLNAHWLSLLMGWATLNAVVISPLAQQFPASGGTGGKILNAVAHLSPLDVLRAWKAIGAELVPPMGMLVLMALSAGVVSCKASLPPDPPAVAAAKEVQKQYDLAAINCAEATGVVDKLNGKGWLAITYDEIKDCWAQFGQAFQAALQVKQAQDAAKAAEMPLVVSAPVDGGHD